VTSNRDEDRDETTDHPSLPLAPTCLFDEDLGLCGREVTRDLVFQ
jgi:hypothetical protein